MMIMCCALMCASPGGLDERIQSILGACRDQGIPVVFAMSRRTMGCAYRSSAVARTVSVIGLLLLDDVLPQFKVCLV